ncbi:MAG: PEP-CTERM sorting domain-containing protein [Burkholderiales bacterium]|nr:PEP-CTERM sorting domain-containing protein [Burkholderiales bacterium]
MKTSWASVLNRSVGMALITLAAAGNVQAAQQAYLSGSSEPWGDYSNVDAMTAAFGTGWDRLQYGASFSDYAMLYIDGGSETATEMVDYLDGNRGLLESYVLGGGHLFINAATEFQSHFDLVFGASSNEQLFENRSYSASAVDPTNTLFDGAGTSWAGYHFSHNDIAAPDTFRSLIVDDVGRTVLSGGSFGAGYVMLGGQTNTAFHASINGSDPFQLRVNELLYTNAPPPPIVQTPVPEPGTYAMLLLGLASVWVVRKRKASRQR